jgi:hypothetical protein
MRIKTRTKTEEYLRAAALPEQTETYTVISHSFIIEKIREMLAKEGFTVKQELYLGEELGDIGMGFMIMNNNDDPDMSMTFNWTNSYNKKLKFSCSIGGFIYDNNVQFISSNESIQWTRKHTGTALDETELVIENIIKHANEHFTKIIEMKNNYINTKISIKDFGRILGAMYFEKNIITPDIASKIRSEYKRPSQNYTHSNTLWELFKITMGVVKETSPIRWYNQQIKLNDQFAIEYLLMSNQKVIAENLAITEELKQLDGPIRIVQNEQLSLEDIFSETNIVVEEDAVCLPPTQDAIEQPEVDASVVTIEVEPDDFIIEEIESIDTENPEDEVMSEEATIEDVIVLPEPIIEKVEVVVEEEQITLPTDDTDDILIEEEEDTIYEEDTNEIDELLNESDETLSEEEENVLHDISRAFISDSLRKDTTDFMKKYYKNYSIDDCEITELNSTYVLTIKQTNESFMINK